MTKHHSGQILTGLGLTAIATAGAYLFYGNDAKKHRKQVKSWAMKLRAETLEKIEKLRAIDKATYERIIDDVAQRYEKIKDVSAEELSQLSHELKGHWKKIQKDIQDKPARKKKKA